MRDMAIADTVREARLRAGLTQAALAERAGVPKSTVGRIESGARTPSVELVERLVRAAGFELTPSLSEPDPGTDSMFERTLRRTPAQRLADATRAARFVLHGRREVAAATDG
jgi:transcriptional regulator with XRE-family HTH domain